MQLLDIWQALGTPQLAEITAVVSIAISLILAQKGQQQAVFVKQKKRIRSTSQAIPVTRTPYRPIYLAVDNLFRCGVAISSINPFIKVAYQTFTVFSIATSP